MPSGEPETVQVVTTIYPMEYFTRRVGSGAVELMNLVQPGIEAHTFGLTARHLRALASADLVVMNGQRMEPWLEGALEGLGDEGPAHVMAAADDPLASSDPPLASPNNGEEPASGPLDPHVWLDPLLAIGQVERIRDALARAAPQHEVLFGENAGKLVQELQRLHARFESALVSCRHRHFVTAHAAYGHLAQRYHLEQVAISGLSPEAEPSPRWMAAIADQVSQLELRYVLVEPALGRDLPETIARETGAGVLMLHSLGSVTAEELAGGGDYLGLMEQNLQTLVQALECNK